MARWRRCARSWRPAPRPCRQARLCSANGRPIAGLRRNGAISPGGGCHLLQTADGWLAASLVRECDWAAVPAWLECSALGDCKPWAPSSRRVEPTCWWSVRGCSVCRWALRPHGRPPAGCGMASRALWSAAAEGAWRVRPPRVLDLSSLWAGPLCSHLLQALGARVLKVESRARPRRPDGPADFHDLLNAGKRSVALEFEAAAITRLQQLIDWADVVIEGSRPRALRASSASSP